MTVTILTGDCRDILPTLPPNSVQTCVTSPPYFGLRDYGTAQWDGGDSECDHQESVSLRRDSPGGFHNSNGRGNQPSTKAVSRQYSGSCPKCGAIRIDAQIGLEPTVDAYVAELVAVFREVRRVLRDDGCVFLNLGDSYFGGGGYYPDAPSNQPDAAKDRRAPGAQISGARIKGRGRSARAADAPAYGTSGTGGSDSPGRDSTSQNRGDGHTSAQSHRTTGSDFRHALEQAHEWCSRIRERMEELHDHLPIGDCSDLQQTARSSSAILDHVRTAIHEAGLALSFLESMPPESWQQHQEDSRLSGSLSAYQSSLRSFVAGAQAFAHTLGDVSTLPDGTFGTASPFEQLVHHIRCTVACCSMFSSWLNPPEIQPHCTTKLKPKDLIGIPWRVAFALQADGWYLRSEIIWHKSNPMPESVRDRPTKSHEQIFLLSKSPRYYYDAAAIAEQFSGLPYKGRDNGAILNGDRKDRGKTIGMTTETRNKRSVWTVATQPYSDAHFATFPPKLIEPCILAGTSERGQCPACGAPWVRVVERERQREGGSPIIAGRDIGQSGNSAIASLAANQRTDPSRSGMGTPVINTIGWQPSCTCDAGDPVPQIVLDPFGGSGTTGEVANRLGRHSILIELNPAYRPLIETRTAQQGLPLGAA